MKLNLAPGLATVGAFLLSDRGTNPFGWMKASACLGTGIKPKKTSLEKEQSSETSTLKGGWDSIPSSEPVGSGGGAGSSSVRASSS